MCHSCDFTTSRTTLFCRIDSSDDNKISKEEFTSESIKPAIEKWVGAIEDWEAEFDKVKIRIIFNVSSVTRFGEISPLWQKVTDCKEPIRSQLSFPAAVDIIQVSD